MSDEDTGKYWFSQPSDTETSKTPASPAVSAPVQTKPVETKTVQAKPPVVKPAPIAYDIPKDSADKLSAVSNTEKFGLVRDIRPKVPVYWTGTEFHDDITMILWMTEKDAHALLKGMHPLLRCRLIKALR